MPELTVSAGLARGLMELALSKGADRRALARASGVELEALDDPDLRVPLPRYVALMRAGQALTGDPALALHYGQTVDLAQISIAGLLFQASETFAELFVLVNRYGKLVVEVDVGSADRFQLQRDAAGVWLVDTRPDANAFPELTEATFARFICAASRWVDARAVRAVHVTHPAPAYQAEYERVLGVPVAFDQARNALLMDEARLTARKPQQPRYVFGILSEHAEALLAELQASKLVRGRVESLLMPLLHTGEVRIDAVAGRMGLSRQTLYRRLRAEGVTFERVLDELRHRLARHYLAGGKVSVNETAYLVGFSDPAAFSRAFKRWTGVSPREAR